MIFFPLVISGHVTIIFVQVAKEIDATFPVSLALEFPLKNVLLSMLRLAEYLAQLPEEKPTSKTIFVIYKIKFDFIPPPPSLSLSLSLSFSLCSQFQDEAATCFCKSSIQCGSTQ